MTAMPLPKLNLLDLFWLVVGTMIVSRSKGTYRLAPSAE
jgi:hypothetical protein